MQIARPPHPARPRRGWRAPLASTGADPLVERIAAKVLEARRIDREEALVLHDRADILTLGLLADSVRRRLHPQPVDHLHRRPQHQPDQRLHHRLRLLRVLPPAERRRRVRLPREEIVAKVRETADLGGRQILMQGGHHPYIKTDWWCDLISDLAHALPADQRARAVAPELDHLAKLDKRPVDAVIADLKAAGLGSVPGAGAEMLVERVRKIIAPKKTSTERWLEVHRRVHEAGLRSSATMMFGHVETSAERVEHSARVRDPARTRPAASRRSRAGRCSPTGVPEQHKYPAKATPGVYLRVQALARIFLDNVANIQTSYVTQGVKLAQVTLRYGCNDFGGTMLEENVVSAAGCFHLAGIRQIERAIERAGFRPLQRNSWYGIVDPRFAGPTPRADR
jgi:cyclic dehypoxanthinyl futalosine synthase